MALNGEPCMSVIGNAWLPSDTQSPEGSLVILSAVAGSPVMELFEETGAYLRGHFRLTSGLHSTEYLQCALVLQHPGIAEQLGRALAIALRKTSEEPIQIVVAPAMGGLIIGHEVARSLDVRFLFTERDP